MDEHFTDSGSAFDGGMTVVENRIDVNPAIQRISSLTVRLLTAIGVEGMRIEKEQIPVDTGAARDSITYNVDSDGTGVKIGILSPMMVEDGGSNQYPAMLEAGIRKHFVSFFNPDGSIRSRLVNWFEKKGMEIWQTTKKGTRHLKYRGVNIGPIHIPWLTNSLEALKDSLSSIMQSEVAGKL